MENLREEDRRVWRRHPGDAARLVFRLGVLGALVALTALTPSAMRNVSADLIRLFARIPPGLRDALVGIALIAVGVIAAATLMWLVLRRTVAETALVVGAAVVSGVVMALLIDWLERAAPPEVIADLPSDWYVGIRFPSPSHIAALVAGATAASPLMNLAWRRMTWIGVAVAVVVRLLTATEAPVNLAVTLALGAAMGSAALVAVGSPQRRPGAGSLRRDLARAGLDVDRLVVDDAVTGRRTYRGAVGDDPIRVAYLDRDDRDADLLARFVRSLRVHSIDEGTISTAPRERVEHEAVVTMLARDAGVSVPRVRAVVPSARDTAVIALGEPPGRPLSDLEPDAVSEQALTAVWQQLAILHDARIAHRQLSPSHLVVDGDEITLVGLESARLAASDDQCAADVAALLVAAALAVGVDRAVDSAHRTLDTGTIESALPFVQPAALPAGTRRALRGHKHLVGELRTGLQDRVGVEEVPLAELERISLMRIVTWVGFAILGFFVLTLVTSWDEIRDAMSGIEWAWTIPVVVGAILSTVGGAISLAGSVPRPIPLGGATLVMYGQSFLNRFTPANAGGMAMRIRYLQKGGTNPATATAAIGLTSAASGVLQAVFIVFFFLWAGTNPTTGVETGDGGGPDLSIVLVFVVAIVLAVVVIAANPSWRRRVVGVVRSTFAKVRADLGELTRQPTKMAMLFGGSALTKLATIAAFVASCRAFGIDLPFSDLGARYLGASAVASAIPTPGGVGAIEAALPFMLTSAKVDEATAWAAVLLFRLIHYWLPTIPGYVALKVCERRELV